MKEFLLYMLMLASILAIVAAIVFLLEHSGA